MVELLKIAKSAESEAVKLAALRDVLDRAGLSAARKIDVEVDATWDETFEGILRTRSDDVGEAGRLREHIRRLERALEARGAPANVVPLPTEDYRWGSREDGEFTPPPGTGGGPRSTKADLG